MSVHSLDHGPEFALDPLRSFWEVGQYRSTVRRLDDGNDMCGKMVLLLQERGEIEKKYAKSLKQWTKKWNDTIDKGPEYGTNKSSWKSTLIEADRRHDIHRDICNRLNTEIVTSIKAWQKENYHKKMMNGFKETIELDEGFRKAQKQWANLLKKCNNAQKNYYSCCKQEKSAEVQEKVSEGDTTLSPDQIKKIQDKRDKCNQDTNKSKDKYESALEDLNEHNPRYIEDMTVQFKKAQDYEKKRLQFFKKTLIDTQKVLNLSVDPKFTSIYVDFMNTLQNSDSDKDLKWWSANHGINMSMGWPAFEEYSDQVHAISSKKSSKGNVGGTGGDGIVVSSFKSTSDQDVNDPTLNSNTPASAEDGEPNDFAYDAEEDNTEALMSRPGTLVKALYDYDGVEADELTFQAGEEFDKLEDEDEQGWCKGRINGRMGLYPANYASTV